VSDEFEHISRGGSLSSMTTGSISSSSQQHPVGIITRKKKKENTSTSDNILYCIPIRNLK